MYKIFLFLFLLFCCFRLKFSQYYHSILYLYTVEWWWWWRLGTRYKSNFKHESEKKNIDSEQIERIKNKQHCLTSHFSCFQSTPVRLRVFEAIYSKTESPINWTILWLRTQDNSQQINNKKKFSSLCSFSAIFCALWSERWINNRNSTNKNFFSLFFLLTCIHTLVEYVYMCVYVLDCHVPCSFDICQNSREIYMYCVCAVSVCVCVNDETGFGPTEFLCVLFFFFFSLYSNCNVTNAFIPNAVQRRLRTKTRHNL